MASVPELSPGLLVGENELCQGRREVLERGGHRKIGDRREQPLAQRKAPLGQSLEAVLVG